MIYQKPHFSKLIAILWMITLSLASTCGDYEFTHDGNICAYGNPTPNSVANVCPADPATFVTLQYCKVSECLECAAVDGCLALYQEVSYKALSHSMKSVPGIYVDTPVACRITDEEYCYRSGTTKEEDATFLTEYEEISDNTATLPDCCMVECDEKFTFSGKGCGVYNNVVTGFYTDELTFCQAYCNNRQLTLKNCGEGVCNIAQCEDTEEECVANFSALAPVCATGGTTGEDVVLINTKQLYCAAKTAGTVSSYYTSGCNNGCDSDNCDMIQCNIVDLLGYPGVGICDNNGVFYYNTPEYCVAKYEVGSDITGYVNCEDNEPCTTIEDCCFYACKKNNPLFNGNCTSTYSFIEDLDSYCTQYCGNEPATMIFKTGQVAYTKNECSSLNCQNGEMKNDVCYLPNYDLLTNKDFCDDKYVLSNTTYTTINFSGCVNSESVAIDCDVAKCNYKKCLTGFTEDQTNICAKNDEDVITSHANAADFCSDQGLDSSLTTFACTVGCDTDASCCEAYCLANHGEYTKTCNSDYSVYNDLAAYCTGICGGAKIANCGTVESPVNCTEVECWKKDCLDDVYKDGCDSGYNVIDKETFCTEKSTNGNVAPVLEYCGENSCLNCKSFKCRDQTNGLQNQGLCIRNHDGLDQFYQNPAAYCTAAILTARTEFSLSDNLLCNNDACLSTSCCDLECKDVHSGYKDSCNKTTYQYINLSSLCTNYCSDDPKYDLSELTDCETGCDENDCKVLDCSDTIILAVDQTFICLAGNSFVDYFFENKKMYCEHLVESKVSTYELETQANCSSADCSDDPKCCLIRCKEQTYFDSCQAVTFDFIDQDDFCNNRCTNDSDFNLITCMTSGDEPTQTNCTSQDCIAKDCQDTHKDFAGGVICLPTPDYKGELYADVTAFCSNRASKDSIDFDVSADTECTSSTCAGNECCEAVCATRTDYNDSCDPVDFEHINLNEYCKKWCVNYSYAPLTCEGSNCTENDCEKKKCLNTLSSSLPAGVCLDTEVQYNNAGVSYFANVNDYCNYSITVPNNLYPIPSTVECSGNTICASERDCYAAKCVKDNEYIAKCDPVLFKVLTEKEACEFKFDNGKSDSALKTCQNSSKVTTACTNCDLFECEFVNSAYALTEKSICLTTSIEEENHFATVKDFCETFILTDPEDFSLSLLDKIFCGAEGSGDSCSSVECCNKLCLSNPKSGCKPGTFEYKNSTDYCNDKCAGNLYEPILCSGDCDGLKCAKLNCEADLIAIEGSICLTTGANGVADNIYYGTVALYCNAIAVVGQSDYTLTDYQCSGASCASSEKCCERNCNTETFNSKCKVPGFDLFEKPEYCELRCNKSQNPESRSCYGTDNVSVISCTNCDQTECEYNTETTVGSITYPGVCGSDDTYYTTIREFCRNKLSNNITLSLCSDGENGEENCKTSEDCCKANCLIANSNFVPVCTATFEYISSAKDYCDKYCPSKSLPLYTINGDVQRECSIQACIAADGYTEECSQQSFALVTLSENCADKYDNTTEATRSCGASPCDEDACLLQQCEFGDLKDYVSTSVCTNTNTLYDTKALYCLDKDLNQKLLPLECVGECSKKQCCELNCRNSFTGTVAPFCDSLYSNFANAADFCTASCNTQGVQTLNILTCGDKRCTANECCVQNCEVTASDVCDPTDTVNPTTPVPSATYCANKCASGVTYTDKIEKCADDCKTDDCEKFSCEYQVVNDYGLGKVCGSNRTFYDDAPKYCEAKLVLPDPNTLSYIKCLAGETEVICGGAITCCNQACNNEYGEGFAGKCTSDNDWAETSTEYCSNVCNNPSLTNKTCPNAVGQGTHLCDEIECCNLRCQADSYTDVCGPDFTYLDKDAYCNLYCADNLTTFYGCTGACQPIDCEKKECKDKLTAYETKDICLANTVNDKSFYTDLDEYCNYVAANSMDYSTNNFIACVGDCKEKSCCVARCNLTQGYLKKCHPTDYALLDLNAFCEYTCSGNEANTLDTCSTNGVEFECSSCELFKCLDVVASYTGKLCLNGDVDGKFFFDNIDGYCRDKVTAGEVDYSLETSDLSCTDNKCDELSECCELRCNNDSTVKGACLLTDYSTTSKSSYCTEVCKDKKNDYVECSSNPCGVGECETLQCKGQNSTFNNKSVCYVFVDQSNPNNVVFFNNLTDYCAEKTTTPSDSYTVSGEQLCKTQTEGVSAPCASETECCKNYCLTQPYTVSCNALHNAIDQETYCTNFCDANGVYPMNTCKDDADKQVACSDCKLFKCLEDIAYNSTNPKSVCIADALTDYKYFTSYNAYCKYLIQNNVTEYTLNDNQNCGLGTGCSSDSACCKDFCNKETFSGVCDPTSFAFINQSQYCDDICSETPTAGLITCDADGCIEEQCQVLKCENAYSTYPAVWSVCLSTSFNNKKFFGSVNELCSEKALLDNTNYQFNDLLYCKDNKPCASSDECNEALCLTETTLAKCDPVSYEPVSPENYCKRKYIDKENVTYDECYSEVTDQNPTATKISCTSCNYFQCLDENVEYDESLYICTVQDINFANIEKFCEAKKTNAGLTVFDCEGVCDEDIDCCKPVCLHNNPVATYVPKCRAVDFVVDKTPDDYCTRYCDNNRTYVAFGDENACCVQKCIVEGGTGEVCNLSDYTPITVASSCADSCGAKTNNYKSCGSPSCDQTACKKLQCRDVFLAGYTFTSVCASNDTYYTTIDAFCNEQIKDPLLVVRNCDANGCNNDAECCEANCLFDQFGSYNGIVCDTENNTYTNPAAYCKDSCNGTAAETKTLSLCTGESGTVPCDQKQCCVNGCTAQINYKICDALIGELAITAAEYCEKACPGNHDSSIKKCTGVDCTDAECKQHKCEYDTKINHGNTSVCANNSVLYETPALYCNAKIASLTPETFSISKCFGNGNPKVCDNAKECRENVCLNRFPEESFTARCATDYKWYTNKENYCNNLSSVENLIDYAICGTGLNELCSEEACCDKLCNQTDYAGVCSDSYQLLDKTDYCTQKCYNKATFYNCEGNACANQRDCEEVECLTKLDAYKTTGICLDVLLTETYHYSLISYCDLKVDGNKDYSEGDFFKCGTGASASAIACESMEGCCNGLCNDMADYMKGCSSDHELIEQAVYCSDYKCGDLSETDINKCENAGQIVKCNNCDIFRCLDNNKDFIGTVCLNQELEGDYHFDDINSYCTTKVVANAGLSNYTLNATDTKCTGYVCGDEKACCNKRCSEKGDKQDKCAADFTVYSVSKQCSDECNSLTPASSDCNGGCNQDKCDIQKCESLNSAITGTVCTTNSIDSVNFFNNINEYCTEKNDSANHFDVIVSIPCADCDVAKCCSSICQQDQLTTCNAATYQTVDPKTFCDDECLETPLLTVDLCYDDSVPPKQIACVNCYLFECLDAYTATATANGGKICLSPATGDNFHFSDVDLYCEFLIGGNVTNFAPIVNFACTDGVCSSPEECCHDQCVETTNDACKADFTFVSKSEICTAQCAGTPLTGQTDCGGVDCTVAKCLARKCVNDWGVYSGPVCLEDDSSSYNYYASVSEYCTDISDDVGGAYVTTNPAYCTASACDGETNCCEEVCSSDKTNNLCDPDTYDVLTPSQYCEKDCKADTEKISCSNNQGNISCTVDECKRLKCLKVFDDADYIGTELCLSTAYENKYLYTVEEYCQEQSTEPAKVTAVPTNQRCKSDEGIEETCSNDDDCCYAACIAVTLYSGCDDDDNLRTPKEICDAKCGGDEYVIDFCPGKNCPNCGIAKCLSENPNNSSGQICMITSIGDSNYYSNIEAFCTANIDLGVGNYSVGNTVKCDAPACENSADCCVEICMKDGLLSGCDSTTFDFVSARFMCTHFCNNNQTYSSVPCKNALNVNIECTVELCNAQHKCPDFFGDRNSSGSFCLDNAGAYEFYKDVEAYCDIKGETIVTQLPTEVSCPLNAADKPKCDADKDCCKAVCLKYQTLAGCTDTFDFINPEDYCTTKCTPGTPPTLNYCGASGCTDCKLLKCLADVAAFPDNTICLQSNIPTTTQNYFNSKEEYCNAMIAKNQTDYTLNLGEYFDCEGDCLDKDCCLLTCNAGTYVNTCNANDFSLVSKDVYCADKCGSKTLGTTPCLNASGATVPCSAEQCCADKIEAQDGSDPLCGSNGTYYGTPLEYCVGKNNNASLTSVDCNGTCTESICKEQFCNANESIHGGSFPSCGSNNLYYANQSSFCTAYSSNTTLEPLEGCGGTCSTRSCCEDGCADSLLPVVYFVGNSPVGYENACLGVCAEGTATPVFTCEANVSVVDCIAEYVRTCGGDCENYLTSTTDYCTVEDGHLNAPTYCSKYICSESSYFGDEVTELDCAKYDCSAAGCANSLCLYEKSCSETEKKVCGVDGNVYFNQCHLECANVTKSYDCPDGGDCEYDCKFDKCSLDNKNDAVDKICAADGIIYDKASVAVCIDAANVDNFLCAKDCNGQVRELRCKFDCQFNNK